MARMDLPAAAIVANVVDLATWYETAAQEIDAIRAASQGRPLSSQESHRIAEISGESLRRMGQHHVLMLTLYVPELRASPVAPPVPPVVVERVPWWRRWLRRVVG